MVCWFRVKKKISYSPILWLTLLNLEKRRNCTLWNCIKWLHFGQGEKEGSLLLCIRLSLSSRAGQRATKVKEPWYQLSWHMHSLIHDCCHLKMLKAKSKKKKKKNQWLTVWQDKLTQQWSHHFPNFWKKSSAW